eukprot:scaffold396913_cov40-Attheya_sp.AAC.1
MEQPRSFRVAPWHFSPENRKRDENGKWVFRERDVYADYDRANYAFPPPNYNPKHFVTEVRQEKHGIERRHRRRRRFVTPEAAELSFRHTTSQTGKEKEHGISK